MKPWLKITLVCVPVLFIGFGPAGAEGLLDEHLRVSLDTSAEYTDNRDSSDDAEKESTWDYRVSPKLETVFTRERMFLELMYRPTFRYLSNAAENQNDEEWLHAMGLNLHYDSGRRLSFRLRDFFDYTDDPEIDFGEDLVRPNESFYRNRLSLIGDYLLASRFSLNAEGGYEIKRYDESEVADYADEDRFDLTVRLQRQQLPDLSLSTLVRYSLMDRDNREDLDRDFESFFFGGGLNYVFSRYFIGNLDLGYQMVQYSAEGVDDNTSPFVDGSLHYAYSELTDFYFGASYSISDAYSYPFISQDRTYFYGGMNWEPHQRIKFGIQGEYRIEEYDGEDVDPDTPEGAYIDERDGDTTTVLGAAWIDFRLKNRLTLRLYHSIEDADSDVETSFTRNRTRITLTKVF